jgi:hypothetical protein
MSYELKLLDSTTYQQYHEFLLTMPNALLYHTTLYRDLLSTYLKCKVEYWLLLEQGEITGVLPLMSIDGPWGEVINSLPFYGSTAGVFAKTDRACQLLIEKYNERTSEKNVAAATLIDNPFQKNAGLVEHHFIDHRISQVTDLRMVDNADLFSRIDSSARRNINKARKSGIKVAVDSFAIDFLYKTHVANMNDIHGKAKERAFFDLIPSHFKPEKDYRIYVAYYNEQPIAALLLFYYKQFVEYFTPVTQASFKDLQPMALILSESMQDAVREGYHFWNWGGTWLSQEGVYRFKKKWAADDIDYRYYTKVNNKDLLKLTPEQLLDAYPNFFVLPFSLLGEKLSA